MTHPPTEMVTIAKIEKSCLNLLGHLKSNIGGLMILGWSSFNIVSDDANASKMVANSRHSYNNTTKSDLNWLSSFI